MSRAWRSQTCSESCRSIFGLFFVVSDGDKCICGLNSTSESREETNTCDTPCAGDDLFTCGGDDSYELY
ncbi:unnamed protein product, partial [Ectocarpus fasciculatus]